METTRERIADHLREEPADPTDLAAAVDTTPQAALEHVRHLARSLEAAGERLEVAPPTCEDCGFDGFDDPANRPSRCPECKGENLTDPVFRVA
jgi:predicted Zn-ribbon and HTH transcriptional regulator